MAVTEPSLLERRFRSVGRHLSAQLTLFSDADSPDVRVDAEWRIVRGYGRLADMLGIDWKDLVDLPIGWLLHPDDVKVSPRQICRDGKPAVLRFLHGTEGYVRLSVEIISDANGWVFQLAELNADVVELRPIG